MTHRHPPIPWRAVVRGVAIVYGITFVAGLVFAGNGITPQTNPVLYPFLALLAGAVGVGVALRVADTTRLSYLVAMGVGVWLLSATSVVLGAQSFTGWLESSLFITTTVILGRLLLGVSLDGVQTSAKSPYSALVHRATQTRRNA
jgi:hypothetical protein